METVVHHRNGELLARVRRKLVLSGVIQVFVGLVWLFVGLTILSLGSGVRWAAILMFVFFGIHLLVGLLYVTGVFTPAYAKVEAPGGVAWVLRPDGVQVNLPAGPVVVPWARVRFTETKIGGLHAIRVGDDAFSTTYATEYLSHDIARLSADAERLTRLR
ncbi:hypothetical protein GCM10027418_20990 [Mariniluteicoccus endophyticus]